MVQNNEKIKCEHCDHETDNPNSMKVHATKHDEAKFMCDVCSKKFKSARYLRSHKLRDHDNKYLLPCSHCDKKFKNRYKLQAHMSYVTGKMPYQCRICKRDYLWISALRKHFDHHHMGELLFECRMCNYKSNNRWAIKAHKSSLEHLKLEKEIELKSKQVYEAKEDLAQAPEIYKCQSCEYCNTNPACVKRHYSIKHLAQVKTQE